MITYALARDAIRSVPEEFRQFILANVEVCNTIEDVVNGFLPHFRGDKWVISNTKNPKISK